MQVVIMSLLPKENIPMEIHTNHDQFIRIEKGRGIAIVGHHQYDLRDGIALVIPANTSHKIINTSKKHRLKLYTIYTPPEHPVGTVQLTKPHSG
jgi:mannose-6-phosphate isomerase-like protein (cupin superfamily)